MAALETAEETSASGQEIRSAAESARDQVSSASAKARDALETARMTAAKMLGERLPPFRLPGTRPALRARKHATP